MEQRAIDNKKSAETSGEQVLTLSVLGTFSATFAGRELALTTRKAKALIGYLAFAENAQDTRERLIALLWSESDEERARASLRQAIYEIRAACTAAGMPNLHADKQALAITGVTVTTDVDEIVNAASVGSAHPRLHTIQRILDSLFDDLDSVDQAFHAWVLAKRQLLHDRLTVALERHLPGEHDEVDASSIAQALLNLDPTHEVACRHLIRARARKGDIGGAMKIYKTLWDLLEADYDVEPSPETQDLIVGIKQAPPAALPTAVPDRTPAPPRKLIISVVPFDAGGIPDEKRHLVNGFGHELVACLVRFREWSVRMTAPVKDPEPRSWSAPPEYLVEGSAYEQRGVIRLVLTFRDAVTSVMVWSDRYTITLAEWFDIQERIVRRIATALNVHLSAERLRRATAEPAVPLEIHDRWLRGQTLIYQAEPADLQAAGTIFAELVRDAPDFSPALSSVVQINNFEHIIYPGQFRDHGKHLANLRLAQRAVQLDPLDSRAQLSLAWSHQLVGRPQEATLHAGLAAELNENDPWTLMSCGQIFAYCGDYARAQALAGASLASSSAPTRLQMTYLSAIRFLCGSYDESIQAIASGLDASPGFAIWKCAALVHLGRMDEARAEIKQVLARTQANWSGQTRAAPEEMLRWLLHMFPIAVESDWERLRAAFKTAGAPVDSITFYRP